MVSLLPCRRGLPHGGVRQVALSASPYCSLFLANARSEEREGSRLFVPSLFFLPAPCSLLSALEPIIMGMLSSATQRGGRGCRDARPFHGCPWRGRASPSLPPCGNRPLSAGSRSFESGNESRKTTRQAAERPPAECSFRSGIGRVGWVPTILHDRIPYLR